MSTVIAVGVKELKNQLSEYLRRIRTGVRVLVTDRNEVVAEIRRPEIDWKGGLPSVISQWISEGKIISPEHPKQALKRLNIRAPEGTAARLLNEDREP